MLLLFWLLHSLVLSMLLFDGDYILVCVAVDVVVAAGLVVVLVVVAIDDAGVPAVVHM